MKKHFKVISLIAIIALVISIGMVGCTIRRPAKPSTPYSNQINRTTPRTTPDYTNVPDYMTPGRTTPDYTTTPEPTITDHATRIANKVAELKEVKKATVTISGNTALVGVSTASNVEGKMTTALKDKIVKAVKETDTNITNVHVTANADLYKRIENIGRDIRAGKPLSGFAAEIKEIIRRITPTTK